MDAIQISVLALAAFMAAIIKGAMGIGAGIFLLPMLTLVFPPFTAIALTAPVMFFLDALGLVWYWKEWLGDERLHFLLFSGIAGAVVGVFILPFIPTPLIKFIVGISGVWFSQSYLFPNFPLARVIRSLLPKTTDELGKGKAVLYGGVAGIINAVASSGGIFFAMYLMTLKLEKRVFVSSVILVVLGTSIAKMIGYSLIGILPLKNFAVTVAVIPLIIMGGWLGNRCNLLVPVNLFRQSVFWLILIVSSNVLLSLALTG